MQSFLIELHLDTDCSEFLSKQEVLEYLKEQFYGCDVGTVSLISLNEYAYPMKIGNLGTNLSE